MTSPAVTSPAAISDRAEFLRKAIHLLAAVVPVGWAYGYLTGRQVRGIALALLGGALAVEALRRALPAVGTRFIALLGPLLRPHERAALTGATLGAVAMAVVVFALPARAAQVALWAGIVGDASAAIVGRLWHRARATPRGRKTLAGSAAAVLTIAAGAAWLARADATTALLLGASGALAEFPRARGALGDDNLRVTLAVGIAAALLGIR